MSGGLKVARCSAVNSSAAWMAMPSSLCSWMGPKRKSERFAASPPRSRRAGEISPDSFGLLRALLDVCVTASRVSHTPHGLAAAAASAPLMEEGLAPRGRRGAARCCEALAIS